MVVNRCMYTILAVLTHFNGVLFGCGEYLGKAFATVVTHVPRGAGLNI